MGPIALGHNAASQRCTHPLAVFTFAPMTESTSPSEFQCDTHGPAEATYLCAHLLEQPVQTWYCDPPSADKPHPDAWCAACERLFQQEGEWNERNEGGLDIRAVCHHCYEDARAASVKAMSSETQALWVDAVTACHERLSERQALLSATHKLAAHERWDYDQESATLTFSNAGVPAVVADVEFIGSISNTSGTWRWSWANFHLHPNVVGRISAVREYGREHHFAPLVVPQWKADVVDAWELAGVAAYVLEAQGVYRAPTDNGYLFMAIMGIRSAA